MIPEKLHDKADAGIAAEGCNAVQRSYVWRAVRFHTVFYKLWGKNASSARRETQVLLPDGTIRAAKIFF